VVIVTRDEQEVRGRWHYVRDEIRDRGPMGGLVTGLRHIRHERAVVLPIDMPLMTVGFLIYLRDAGMETDITVPRWERVEPLAGVYSRACVEHLSAALQRGADSMGDFVQSTALPVRYIGPEEISRFGDPRRIFFNINHPEDLPKAEALMRGEAPGGSG
jgi:molybdopterin-guanine dinucleotide biosynthesis protein A